MKRARVISTAAVLGIVVGWYALASVVQSGTVKENVERLTDKDASKREQAIVELAGMGRGSVPAYRSLLSQLDSPLAQAGIAEALRRMGLSDDELKSFQPDLFASRPSTRRIVIWLLGSTKPSLLAGSLRTIVTDKRELTELRGDAAAALGTVGGSERDFLWGLASNGELELDVRGVMLRGLARTGPTGVEDVLSLATAAGTPETLRAAAWAALADPKADAVGKLIEVFEDGTASARASAASALGLRREADDATIDALSSLISSDDDGSVRIAALMAACASGRSDELRDPIVGLLDINDTAVQAKAIWALGQHAKDTRPETLTKLNQKLYSPSFWVRYEAALALAEAGDANGYGVMLADTASADAFESATATAAMTVIQGKVSTATKK